MKQSEAVVNAVTTVFEENGIPFEKNTDKASDLLTKELRSQVTNMLTEGFVSGKISLSEKAQAKYDTEEKIRKEYVPGLISNWLRKSQELNGGVKYQPENPGSRTGASDPEIKNLKLLIKSGRLNDEQVAVAEDRISERQAELKTEKAKKVEIDFSTIPENLKEALGI